jgi:predicted amidohydrolase YtcJ
MVEAASLLIRDAELLCGERVDVRLAHGRVAAIGLLTSRPDEPCIAASGGLLLPGLHDHHVHLAATASARLSVKCGPPDVLDAGMLAQALARPGTGWLRGIGYHESVAGMLHRSWLDEVTGERPVRIQHRGGRMWFLNSAAIERLLAAGKGRSPQGLNLESGQLFDEDAWLRGVLDSRLPALDQLGADLSRLGITGITDMGPANGLVEHAYIAAEQARGALPQRVVLAGSAELECVESSDRLQRGPYKIHLHEADLPKFDKVVAAIIAAHARGRGVAVHCVTELELVFALAALRDAGSGDADRIEHAAVAPDTLVSQVAEMGLAVAVQPLFVAERGDAYREDVPAQDWSYLYRLKAFADAGVPIAGSSDAPYVDIDPWKGMAAAVSRRTRSGAQLGEAEALQPGEALALYLADPQDLRRTRTVDVGAAADLCLLDAGWTTISKDLSASHVRLTIVRGVIVHDAGGLPEH